MNAVETVWRMESARLIAGLVRMVRDIDVAEELAQDALVAALEYWPRHGVPDKPGAWLMATAKRRAIDRLRQRKLHAHKHEEFAHSLEEPPGPGSDPTADVAADPFDDELLRLLFIACHPVLPMESRVALTLRLLGGLETPEIARAFLVPEATLAQRIVRAKRSLAEARVPYETPSHAELGERLDAVLAVIYLIFNEGYSASSGEDWIRPSLCAEAMRLGRILAGLLPKEPEVHGLLALMEIQASRLPARTDANGAAILLADQDRSRWDRLLIGRGLDALARAEACGGAAGPYALQAAIAACHARAPRHEDTNWARIAALYAVLATVAPSPVIELNRAVAISMALGPAAALPLVEALANEPQMRNYHLLPGVMGDLLQRLGRREEAARQFLRAAELTRNARDQELLQRRARECTAAGAETPG